MVQNFTQAEKLISRNLSNFTAKFC